MKQEIPYSSAQLLYYAWQLSRNRGGADDDKLTGVLSEARVDLNPHQVMAALFAFQSPFSKGVILADEVGLGKTIEAGIVISQFWAERKRRILIVAPATLRRQWSMELEEKFFLDSFILEKKKGISLDHLSDGSKSISALISLLPDKPKSCRALIGTWWFMMRLINCAMFISQPLRWLPV